MQIEMLPGDYFTVVVEDVQALLIRYEAGTNNFSVIALEPDDTGRIDTVYSTGGQRVEEEE